MSKTKKDSTHSVSLGGMARKSAIRQAFEKWRGPAPVTGYGRDIDMWYSETEELWRCWKMAVRWTRKTSKPKTRREK